jgi:hypothetical protein
MRAARPTAALALLMIGCASPAPPVDLSPDWPSKAPDLEDATEAWTRTDRVVAGLAEDKELIAELTATYKSPAWRTALIERNGARGKLSRPEIDAQIEAAKKDAAEHHEFALLLTTHDRRLNDLTKGERSVWQVRLRDTAGNEVEPVEIKKDRRPRSEIASELPHLDDFDQIYIARFPGDHPILGAGDSFALKMWSGRGRVELVWSSK